MVMQYTLLRISLISSYIFTNKTLILYFVNGDHHIFPRSSYFPAKKPACGRKDWD